jgi:hypothetical protein
MGSDCGGGGEGGQKQLRSGPYWSSQTPLLSDVESTLLNTIIWFKYNANKTATLFQEPIDIDLTVLLQSF